MPKKPELAEIKIKLIPDESPDTSTIGRYTDDYEKGCIVRALGDFYDRLPEDADFPERGREYRYFVPYAAGEPVGSDLFYKYGMEDFHRMETLYRGDWGYLGIVAVAKVKVFHYEGAPDFRIMEFTSMGLWGVESDSDIPYLQNIGREELEDLRDTLACFGLRIPDSKWEKTCKEALDTMI